MEFQIGLPELMAFALANIGGGWAAEEDSIVLLPESL